MTRYKIYTFLNGYNIKLKIFIIFKEHIIIIVVGTFSLLWECIILICFTAAYIRYFIFGEKFELLIGKRVESKYLVLFLCLTFLNLFSVISLILFICKLKKKEPSQTNEIVMEGNPESPPNNVINNQ